MAHHGVTRPRPPLWLGGMYPRPSRPTRAPESKHPRGGWRARCSDGPQARDRERSDRRQQTRRTRWFALPYPGQVEVGELRRSPRPRKMRRGERPRWTRPASCTSPRPRKASVTTSITPCAALARPRVSGRRCAPTCQALAPSRDHRDNDPLSRLVFEAGVYPPSRSRSSIRSKAKRSRSMDALRARRGPVHGITAQDNHAPAILGVEAACALDGLDLLDDPIRADLLGLESRPGRPVRKDKAPSRTCPPQSLPHRRSWPSSQREASASWRAVILAWMVPSLLTASCDSTTPHHDFRPRTALA